MPAAQSEPLSIPYTDATPPPPDLGAMLTQKREAVVAKRLELGDAKATFHSRALDLELAGKPPLSPSKAVFSLQLELETLEGTLAELEKRFTASNAAARRAKLTELSAQAAAIHAETFIVFSQENAAYAAVSIF